MRRRAITNLMLIGAVVCDVVAIILAFMSRWLPLAFAALAFALVLWALGRTIHDRRADGTFGTKPLNIRRNRNTNTRKKLMKRDR